MRFTFPPTPTRLPAYYRPFCRACYFYHLPIASIPGKSVFNISTIPPALLALPFYHLPISSIGILAILPNLFCVFSLDASVIPAMLPRLLALGRLVGKAILPTPLSLANVVALSLPFRYSYPTRSKKTISLWFGPCVSICGPVGLRFYRFASPYQFYLSIHPRRLGILSNWEVYRALCIATGLDFLGRLTILTSVISMGRMTGYYRKEGQYRKIYELVLG